MKKKLFVSMLVILVALVATVGGTMAWFTDADKVENNQFTAGTLLIDIDGFDTPISFSPANPDFTVDRLNPGDKWCYDLEVENKGNKTFKWRLGLFWDEVIGQENDYNLEEYMQELIDREYGTDLISDVLLVTIDRVDENGDFIVNLFGPSVLNSNPYIWEQIDLIEIRPGQKAYFKVCFELPNSAGNAYQGAKMQAGFAVQAWQTTNNAPAPESFPNPFVFWSGY